MHSLRPQIGKYCWDVTIFKGHEEPEAPTEMENSLAEIEEESLLKIRDGLDQMNIEDDVEGTEELEYFDLIPVPDLEINSESQPELEIISDGRPEKVKVQPKITSFSLAKKQK